MKAANKTTETGPAKPRGRKDQLLEIVRIAVANSRKLRLLENQQGFQYALLADGVVIGRDIAMYAGATMLIKGWQAALLDFYTEVILPLKGRRLYKSYKQASAALCKLGEPAFEGELLEEWRGIFA